MARPEHAVANVGYEVAKAEHAALKPQGRIQVLRIVLSELPNCSLHTAVYGDKVCSQMWCQSKIMNENSADSTTSTC